MPNGLLLFLCFLLSLAVSAQKTVPHWEPENIDSLKHLLPQVQDTARINLLNEISFAYFYLQMDSSKAYAVTARREAAASGYGKGEIISLLYQAQGELIGGYHTKAVQLAVQAFELGKRIGDQKSFAAACLFLGYLLPKEKGLLLIDKADLIFKAAGDIEGQLDGYAAKGIHFLRAGQTYDALKIYNRYAALGKQSGHVESYANALQLIGRIYSVVGDYNTAVAYLNLSVAYRERHGQKFFGGYDELFENYMQLKKYDSALYAINRTIINIESIIKDSVIKAATIIPAYIKRGNAYLKLGRYDSALDILLPILKNNRTKKEHQQPMWMLPLISEAYAAKKDFALAVLYGREAVQWASAAENQYEKKNAAGVLATAFHGLRKEDSAYYYLQLSTTLNDLLAARNLQNNMAFYKTVNENEAAEAKIYLLGKDNQLKQQRLDILLGSLAGLLLLGGMVVGFLSLRRKNEMARRALTENEWQIQKLEAEKKQASLQQRAAELEMQALRAQINPHFIFNCLNAINHFILKAETETASDYLTKFSRLIRLVLQHSSQKNISLEDELASLRLYIELEQLRFKKRFQFSFTVDREIDTENVVLPPMLLQPFVENAIWHGLMQKETMGLLHIEVMQSSGALICTITDNGVGRERSTMDAQATLTKKSMGMQITAHRLKLVGNGQENGVFSIIDLKDVNHLPCGTRVVIKIPVVVSETVNW